MSSFVRALGLAGAALTLQAFAWQASTPALTLDVRDYADVPITGKLDGTGNDGSLARVNSLREEPGGRRFFVNDLNGPLYLLDKRSKQFTTYLDFNGSAGHTGLFHRFTYAAGFANGLISFQFDPDYSNNGTFYTVHLEDPKLDVPAEPDAGHLPGFDRSRFSPSEVIRTPTSAVPIDREAVLLAWTDTNIANATFEGSVRELMRVQLNTRIHPMGDMTFNPAARRGDPDWRVMYLACGDGGAGEQTDSRRLNPQRLDTLVGKILRIIPDLGEKTATSTVSGNGRYRIPRDNPFVDMPGARGEIWALGLRNPHRLNWDVTPSNRSESRLFAATVGLHAWETVFIVRKGANYGYPLREGNQVLTAANGMAPLPADDRIPIRISDTEVRGDVAPAYPVIQYPHASPDGGDAIAGGFVYRGRIKALQGKFLFGDISTGRIWYVDLADLAKADDGQVETMAGKREVRIGVHDSLRPIAEEAYRRRGGKGQTLPGRGTVSGAGRVDMRFAVDAGGELYILSKTDGVIRTIVDAR